MYELETVRSRLGVAGELPEQGADEAAKPGLVVVVRRHDHREAARGEQDVAVRDGRRETALAGDRPDALEALGQHVDCANQTKQA